MFLYLILLFSYFVHFVFQITYWIRSVSTGYKIYADDRELVRCVTAQKVPALEDSSSKKNQSPTPCTANTLVYLTKGTKIRLRCIYKNRPILTSGKMTYWGLFLIK